MKTFTEPDALQKWCATRKRAGAKIALVPTMGALHAGHISLIEAAKKQGADEIVVSVFVNPVQFCPGEDYEEYPRDNEADAEKCAKAGATAVFFPTPQNMYLEGYSVYINEEMLSSGLCGALRPGHFRGVCTVVAKLLNITHPNFAVFGQKDFQQQAVVRRMVRDLNFDVKIVTAPIVREKNGLAMSSRNAYLAPAEVERALTIPETLKVARADVKERGQILWKSEQTKLTRLLKAAGLRVDYVEAVDAETLAPVWQLTKGAVVMIAVYCGKTRLIDNAIM